MTISKDETLQQIRDRIPAAMVSGGLSVTPTGTVAVSGPQTDAQARATPLPVDTELPAAGVPADAGANTAIPATASRGQLWNGASWDLARDAKVMNDTNDGTGVAAGSLMVYNGGNVYARARNPANGIVAAGIQAAASMIVQADGVTYHIPKAAIGLADTETGADFPGVAQMLFGSSGYTRARQAADTLPLTGVQGVIPMNWGSDGSTKMQRVATAVGDAETGDKFTASASMLWNGSSYSRARTSYSEVILAAADRQAPTSAVYSVTAPITNSYSFRSVILALRIVTVDTVGGLTVKVLGRIPTTGGTYTLFGQDASKLITSVGLFYFVIGPGATYPSTGIAPQLAASPVLTSQPEFPVVVSSLPLPAAFQFQVYHRGGTTAIWNYEVSASYGE
jgi:hypothetical protein